MALRLGYRRGPEEMLEDLTTEQLIGWSAYFAVDPPTEQRMDERFAMLVSYLCGLKGVEVDFDSLMPYAWRADGWTQPSCSPG